MKLNLVAGFKAITPTCVENLSFMKLVHGAKKVGDRWVRVPSQHAIVAGKICSQAT